MPSDAARALAASRLNGVTAASIASARATIRSVRSVASSPGPAADKRSPGATTPGNVRLASINRWSTRDGEHGHESADPVRRRHCVLRQLSSLPSDESLERVLEPPDGIIRAQALEIGLVVARPCSRSTVSRTSVRRGSPASTARFHARSPASKPIALAPSASVAVRRSHRARVAIPL